MLITPRAYFALQNPNREPTPSDTPDYSKPFSSADWHFESTNAHRDPEMVLIRQAGSVRIGEIIRYTLKYQPSKDEIQPPPTALHIRVKNTSAIPLRAAYLRGPYTLYASCYPKSFDPDIAADITDTRDIPQFEPHLKAGGTWHASIPVFDHEPQRNLRSSGHSAERDRIWVIEIISQVIFSSTASVNFEILVARDAASLDLFPHAKTTHLKAANLRDHWPSGSDGTQLFATKGIYSNSIDLLIDDTASLWNSPYFPTWQRGQEGENVGSSTTRPHLEATSATPELHRPEITGSPDRHRRRVHLVVLTHGLHSNLGADMLYLKESIDAASQRYRSRRKEGTTVNGSMRQSNSSPSCAVSGSLDCSNEDDEHTIVRGFPGNAARTERGIQYLGKRLAKYVLLMTYPDQPYLPRRKPKGRTFSSLPPWGASQIDGHESSSPNTDGDQSAHGIEELRHCQIVRISFIGHSLGGLVQMYAIAYIHKHSPDFFDKIKPANFIALATPFLGLSTENPMYVRFALDLGLVGRTGQDLGLSWTAPGVRGGWETLMGGRSASSNPQRNAEARARPLLRILPSGPAHDVLARFERRTIYSNLVNDGIVPLRTSCLLFLDWRGLQRVEKARRENGIVGTMAEWGWAELTGANSKLPRSFQPADDAKEAKSASIGVARAGNEIPFMVNSCGAFTTHSTSPYAASSPSAATDLDTDSRPPDDPVNGHVVIGLGENPPQSPPSGLWAGLLSIFGPKAPSRKQPKIIERSQPFAATGGTGRIQHDATHIDHTFPDGTNAPPQTTVFESAGDILMPPLPPIDYIMEPSSRPQTILHDRIYSPADIPPPQAGLQGAEVKSPQRKTTAADHGYAEELTNITGLGVEEKIARAYHRGISWRKVLVRLEPDAHNNIIVRRMFANAYGWPVVRHLVDTHFGLNDSSASGDSHEGLQSSTSDGAMAEDSCDERTRLSDIALNAGAASIYRKR